MIENQTSFFNKVRNRTSLSLPSSPFNSESSETLTPRLPAGPKSSFSHSFPLFFAIFSPNSSAFSLSSPLFNETVFSYAVIPWPQSYQSYLSFMEFELTFQPLKPDGTLLYTDDAGSGDFLAINLVDGYVEFRFDCGSGGATIRC